MENETKEAREEVTTVDPCVDKKGRDYYKVKLSRHEATFFVWETKLVDDIELKQGDDVVMTYEPGKYPKVTKIQVVEKNTQTTVNGRQKDTDKQVRLYTASDTDLRIARSVAVKVVAELRGQCAEAMDMDWPRYFRSCDQVTQYIVTGELPTAKESKEKCNDNN